MIKEWPEWKVYRSRNSSKWAKLGGKWVRVLPREEFFKEFFVHEPGDHLVCFGPTQIAGKTRLMIDALDYTDMSGLSMPPVLLIAKPRDKTLDAGIARLGYAKTEVWPPKKPLFRRGDPDGWAFWPPHIRTSSKANNEHIAAQFEGVLNETFWAGDTVSVIDEMHHANAILRQGANIDRHLTQGDGMGAGFWGGAQKGSGTQRGAMSGFVFNSATHTFVAHDPVTLHQKRYGEIAGVDPNISQHATAVLPPYYWLYSHRVGPKCCVVEPGK